MREMSAKRRVLLVNPGYYEVGDYSYAYQPPMGLLKIARYLKKKNVAVEYLDFSVPARIWSDGKSLKNVFASAPVVRQQPCGNFESEGISKAVRYYGVPHDEIKRRIKAANPTEVWLGTNLTYYWEAARDVAQICKDIYPDVPVLAGGIYASLFPEHADANLNVDIVVQGPLPDIDDLFPDYSIDTTYRTSRTFQLGKGCHLKVPCSFCAVHAMEGGIFKGIKAQSTFDYIKEEYDKGVNHFQIWSSQLLVPLSSFKDLMRKIIDSDMSITMIASEGIQASIFDQECADLMSEAGFRIISIPMETVSEELTESTHKPSTFNQYERAVSYAQNAGIQAIIAFVMVGIPGQNYNDIVHAIVDCWARDCLVGFHQYTPIPGSEDWEKFPQFHDKSPDQLHPSLWPGASDELKVSYLEEIKRISKMGVVNFCDLYSKRELNRVQEITNLFAKWTREYGLMDTDGYTDEYPLTTPGYRSAYRDTWEKEAIEKGLLCPS
jgi:uncharacterized radical SAM superfamily protein